MKFIINVGSKVPVARSLSKYLCPSVPYVDKAVWWNTNTLMLIGQQLFT